MASRNAFLGLFAEAAGTSAYTLAGPGDALPRAGAELVGRLAGLAERFLGTRTEVLDRPADALDELRVAIECRPQPVYDRRDVLEADLEQRLGLDAADVQAHSAEVRFHAHVYVQQLERLRLQARRSRRDPLRRGESSRP